MNRLVAVDTEGDIADLPRARAKARRPHDGFRHEALLWRDEEEFISGTAPFLQDAVAAGQPVMAALTARHTELLRQVLGPDAARVVFVDMEQLGANPARIIPAWHRFTAEHAGQPVRGIGEPIWPGRRSAEVVECQLHEALLNMAVDPDTPLWLLCPYDAANLPADVLAEAHRSHPMMVDVEAMRASTAYSGADHVQAMFETDLPPADGVVFARGIDDSDPGEVRQVVRAHAASAGLSQARAEDLVLAVHELVVNASQSGQGQGELRVWEQDGSLVCEVRSPGRIKDPMVGRRRPTEGAEHGRGLWLANQLCDLVQIRSGESGTTVRIHSWV